METILFVAVGVALAPLVASLFVLALGAAVLAFFWILIGIRTILCAFESASGKMFDRLFKALS